MTLHEKLKEIKAVIISDCGECGRIVPIGTLTDSTIAAIIQAVEERLPASHDDQNTMYKTGWNAYRYEVRKVLSEKPIVVDAAEINYKGLLRKYIEHVVDCEGVDFILVGDCSRENQFSEQEWKELERMAGELGK